MIISKLKKQLKKTLIESYLRYGNSFFVLESSLKSHLNLQKAIFSINLIGSTSSQIALTFFLDDISLKFPTILKIYLNDQKYDHLRTLSKPNLGACNSILIKKSHLLLRSQIHSVNHLNQKFICIELKLTVFVFLFRVKNITLLLK